MGWGARWEGGSGWGIHVNPWLIHVNVWQNPLQYCKVISLQLIKINEKKFFQNSHYKHVKELKKRMFKGVKEGMMIMFHQIGNINNKTEIILKGKVKLLKLESRVSEIKNSLEGHNNRFQLSEERISRLEDRAIEIM